MRYSIVRENTKQNYGIVSLEENIHIVLLYFTLVQLLLYFVLNALSHLTIQNNKGKEHLS